MDKLKDWGFCENSSFAFLVDKVCHYDMADYITLWSTGSQFDRLVHLLEQPIAALHHQTYCP